SPWRARGRRSSARVSARRCAAEKEELRPFDGLEQCGDVSLPSHRPGDVDGRRSHLWPCPLRGEEVLDSREADRRDRAAGVIADWSTNAENAHYGFLLVGGIAACPSARKVGKQIVTIRKRELGRPFEADHPDDLQDRLVVQ